MPDVRSFVAESCLMLSLWLACVRKRVQMGLVLLLVTDSVDNVDVERELGSCRCGVLLVCGARASFALLG